MMFNDGAEHGPEQGLKEEPKEEMEDIASKHKAEKEPDGDSAALKSELPLPEQKKEENMKKKAAELNPIKEQYESGVKYKIKRLGQNIRSKGKRKLYIFARELYRRVEPHPRVLKCFTLANRILRIFPDTKAVIFYERSRGDAGAEEKYTAVQSASVMTGAAKVVRRKQPRKIKMAKEMNVAMIADEFSYNSFRYECNAFPLEPDTWKTTFEDQEIDFFLCESAWTGTDPDRRPWRGQIYASCNFPKENRTVLLEILKYCKEHKIPTVFWNKEDPTHYVDRVHDFAATAKLFDHVFTTARECVEKYKKDYGLKSVHLLMFATQPKMFNPIEKFERSDAVIFAGSWYRQHAERCVEMEKIFDRILDQNIPLVIYNRQSENSDPNHTFPEKYIPYVRPRLRYHELDAAYKESKMALNINTVKESDTMFARRVFELMSSNTFVLSNYSKGMEELFEDRVAFIDDEKELSVSSIEDKREAALYDVLAHHTYKQRFEQILRDIGMPYTKEKADVTLIYRIKSAKQAQEAYDHFLRQNWDEKKAVLWVDQSCKDLREIVVQYNANRVTVVSEHYQKTYEKTLNMDTEYIAYADAQMENDFIRKAMLHWCYLSEDVGIVRGKKQYSFCDVEHAGNVLLPAKLWSGDLEYTGKVYSI